MQMMMKTEPGRRAVEIERMGGPDRALEWTVDPIFPVHHCLGEV